MARPRYATDRYGSMVGTIHPDTKPATPEPLEDGQERCVSCGRAIRLNTRGSLRKHRDRNGVDCWCRDYEGSQPIVTELPPIHFPLTGRPPSGKPAAPPKGRQRQATGECHDCGKPVTGERWYCGPCAGKRNRR